MVYNLLFGILLIWVNPVKLEYFYSTFPAFHTPYTPIYQQPILSAIPQITVVPQIQPPITYNLPKIENKLPQFKGFSYHTNYQDGTSSTVYFVTGGGADVLPNFPSFKTQQKEEKQPEKQQSIDIKAKSFASDISDQTAIPDVTTYLKNLLEPTEFQQLFDNSNFGAFNYYTFPASTAPLVKNIDTFSSTVPFVKNNDLESDKNQTQDNSENAESTTTTPTTTTSSSSSTTTSTELTTTASTTTIENNDKVESAESRVEDTKILPNNPTTIAATTENLSQTTEMENETTVIIETSTINN